jgi:hypothetical protein
VLQRVWRWCVATSCVWPVWVTQGEGDSCSGSSTAAAAAAAAAGGAAYDQKLQPDVLLPVARDTVRPAAAPHSASTHACIVRRHGCAQSVGASTCVCLPLFRCVLSDSGQAVALTRDHKAKDQKEARRVVKVCAD